VLLDEPINLRFKLFNMIERHGILHHKISRLSLVLTSSLVKPTYRHLPSQRFF
jgi:hypothetical protein